MGMYDEVIVPIKMLPLNADEKKLFKDGHRFQTKDLDCLLDEYQITESGGISKSLCEPPSKRTPSEILINFTDSFNFYSNPNSRWFEFRAYFENGKLKKIDRDFEAEKFYNVTLPQLGG